jgi:glycine cleavage system H protein
VNNYSRGEEIMNFPEELKYTNQHEWVSVEKETALIGITDYAQQALGDVVYIEIPEIGTELVKGDTLSVVESVKAASDIYAPVSGEVIEVNETLEDHPEYVNRSPYDKGWIVKMKIKSVSELDDLMNSQAYREFSQSEDA